MKKFAGFYVLVWVILIVGVCQAEDFPYQYKQAAWGGVKVAIDPDARKHFPLAGWSTEMFTLWGTSAYLLQLKIDPNNRAADTKGCLRATFYAGGPLGERVRVRANMTDGDDVRAMVPGRTVIMDASNTPWFEAVVRWTANCDDTGPLSHATKAEAPWMKK